MNRIESIHVAPTTTPKTTPGRFGTALRAAAGGLARGVAATVELAAQTLRQIEASNLPVAEESKLRGSSD